MSYNSFKKLILSVGSGKSSFLLSLIGEMKFKQLNKPEVIINGDIAFVSQKPWILNDTVKNNIVFGRDYDEEAYNKAIKCSCLEPDLKILPKKDLTEIGNLKI